MKEVVTSSTGAGAFVRNLKGFALYSDKDKSYEIEKFFRGRMLRDTEFFFKVWTLRDIEKFFGGRTLRDIKSDNLILNPSSSWREKFFGGRTLRGIKSDNLILNPSSSGREVYITQGSLHIDSDIYGNNVTHDVRIYCTCTNPESSCGLMTLVFSL
jgi:hypothetical protein